MKGNATISAVIGGAFFAIPYLALSVPVLPSLAIGTAAFCAGELLFSKTDNESTRKKKVTLTRTLQKAKTQNNNIKNRINKIDDEEIRKHLKSITTSVSKIISTIESSPEKFKNVNNFFDYYLPMTEKIIERYDEIEDQNLSSADSKKFIKKTNEMLEDISKAFNKMLNNLYQADIIDIDAEMKVFNSMLKADGFSDNELIINKEEE